MNTSQAIADAARSLCGTPAVHARQTLFRAMHERVHLRAKKHNGSEPDAAVGAAWRRGAPGLWYHREAEKNRLVARVELCSVCALFAYGSLQFRQAPDALALSAEVVCACVTVATYVAGFVMCDDRRCYDFWHPIGLHLVPALWSLLVAGTHPSLVPLR